MENYHAERSAEASGEMLWQMFVESGDIEERKKIMEYTSECGCLAVSAAMYNRLIEELGAKYQSNE